MLLKMFSKDVGEFTDDETRVYAVIEKVQFDELQEMASDVANDKNVELLELIEYNSSKVKYRPEPAKNSMAALLAAGMATRRKATARGDDDEVSNPADIKAAKEEIKQKITIFINDFNQGAALEAIGEEIKTSR